MSRYHDHDHGPDQDKDQKSGEGSSLWESRRMTRREVLAAGITLLASTVLAACGIRASSMGGTEEPSASPVPTAGQTPSPSLPPTPACGHEDGTPEVTEGPYSTPNSPERSSLLEEGMAGVKLTVSGFVLNRDCQPVQGALLDFWQADSKGSYDNTGFRLRGHQYTDSSGAFRLETVVPGLYPGRTRHLHVKVQAPKGKVLTTQLFFPGEPGNAKDGIYRKELLLEKMETADNQQKGAFTFVLPS
ncbi:hypothetical protein MJA45_23540 [Paenibacillus aurantius]|uniref:Intradiol ring-cleavage dioxygenases domain-containing protein n=1 Tax=Paenibacillus aurantius TaxID=2918900 RepID=A0AA96LC38_9BACL|nr:hypothetical protein [Paenibacillus aurantius]WNQ10560.1 hypothetical protein MJA45_23540 [Paenibacillus aurantius]